MKTSNKILLGTFLTGMATVTLIHVALYARYKSGNIVALAGADNSQLESVSFPVIKFVSMDGLQNCTLIPADSMRLEIEKPNRSEVFFKQSGDTLFVSSDKHPGNKFFSGSPTYQPVKIFIPPT